MPDFSLIYQELQGPIKKCGVLLLLLVLSIVAAMVFYSSAQNNLQQTDQALRNSVSAFRKAMDDERILLSEKGQYETLRDRGFVGAELRLRWIEDVRDIALRADLVSIKYQLDSRRPEYTAAATENLQLYASTMRLDLQLRHEGDLLTFLQMLGGRRSGMFDLKSCQLVRLSDANHFHLTNANLNATCEIRWYSLDKPQVFVEDAL